MAAAIQPRIPQAIRRNHWTYNADRGGSPRALNSVTEMAAHPNPEVRDLIEAVTRYLVRNPRARDTADGIGQWWIDSTLFDIDVLPAALEWMLEHGWLEELRSETIGISYGLTAKGLEDGSRLLIDRRSEEWTTDDD